MLKVSRSAFYGWLEWSAKIISEEDLNMCRTARQLLKHSCGSRQLCKKLRVAGFKVGRYRTRSIMCKLKLVVKQCLTYKVTTKRKHSDSVAENVLKHQFHPTHENAVWAGDVTYLLRMNQGRMYLAVEMHLYFR